MEENGMMETSINYDDEKKKSTKFKLMGWILSLGKKVVMTGVVISSLPLLVVGCALSLPFGVVFASYACTDKLMSKLLECDQTVLLPDQEQREMGIDDEDSHSHSHSSKNELKSNYVQVGGYDYAAAEDMNINVGGCGSREDVTSELVQIYKLAENDQGGEKVVEEVVIDHFSQDKNEKVVLDHFSEVVVQEYNDSKQVSAKTLINDDVGDTNSSLEKQEKPVGVPKEMLEAQSVEVHDVCSEITNIDESNTSTAGRVLASKIDVGVLPTYDGKTEHRTVTIYNDPAGENYNKSKVIAAAGGGYTLEITGMTDQLKHDQVMIPEDACAVDSVEGLFGGEEIWKKMEAIRVIVGYKGPRSASYGEELKALYLFTGIEPSPCGELHNKLSFLMSVIGLK